MVETWLYNLKGSFPLGAPDLLFKYFFKFIFVFILLFCLWPEQPWRLGFRWLLGGAAGGSQYGLLHLGIPVEHKTAGDPEPSLPVFIKT